MATQRGRTGVFGASRRAGGRADPVETPDARAAFAHDGLVDPVGRRAA